MADTRTSDFPCERIPEDPGMAKLLGIYSQRQDGLWMQRVKVLGGVLTPQQWDALGRIADELTPGTPFHLTTRQDIELHDLTAERLPVAHRRMAEVHLTGLGGGGDSLRNVTVCPCSGTVGGRPDLLPLARDIRRTLEAEPDILALPRKFKISLSCGEACGQPWINDLGLVADRRDAQWGVRVVAGGSLGARPGTGMLLFDWLRPAEVLPLAVAAVRLFKTHGDREHRQRARLRHVRERTGDDEFARLVREELRKTKQERAWPGVTLQVPAEGFDARRTLTFPNGDVTPAMAAALAEMAGRDDVSVRIANHHRVAVFGRDDVTLAEAISAFPSLRSAAQPQPWVVACPGKRWCGRALVDTNCLADRIRVELGGVLAPGTTVCISGCPNGCAHSAVADIGLTGRLVRRGGQKVQAYDLWAGGGMGRNCKLARLEGQRLSPEEAIKEIGRLSATPC